MVWMVALLNAGLALVLLSWVAERWLPLMLLPLIKRPLSANLLHASALLAAFGVMLMITARPGLSAALVLAVVILLVLVNRDKYRALREPFLACDFVYFTDAIRHPKLYLPYFGYGKAALLSTGFVLLVWAWWTLEPRLTPNIFGGTVVTGGLFVALGAGIIIWIAPQLSSSLLLEPATDLQQLGLMAMLTAYQTKAWQTRKDPVAFLQAGPFSKPQRIWRLAGKQPVDNRAPLILCLQLESFVDFRRIYTCDPHHPELSHAGRVSLPAWDRLCSQAWATGALRVPAFGANTVRSEFEFLLGVPVSDLGVHGFEPYQWLDWQARAGGFEGLFASLPAALKKQGFKTMFVHPYDHRFYRRNRVLPMLGFDTFLDDRAFRKNWEGRSSEGLTDGIHGYISDAALGKKLVELVQAQSCYDALFVHGVTMQGHGPYVHGRGPHSPNALFAEYQACMLKTDQMLGQIWSVLNQLDRPVVLCAFGDHVPILPEVYEDWGMPDGTTDYVIWRNWENDVVSGPQLPKALSCHQLGARLLAAAGIQMDICIGSEHG